MRMPGREEREKLPLLALPFGSPDRNGARDETRNGMRPAKHCTKSLSLPFAFLLTPFCLPLPTSSSRIGTLTSIRRKPLELLPVSAQQ